MDQLYAILLHAHSGLRWLVLIFLVLAVAFSLTKWMAKKPFWATHKKVALFGLIFTHLQIVLGLILYFISPKVIFSSESMHNSMNRFFLVEHITGMIIAAILVTIGYAKAKRSMPEVSAKYITIYYLVALILILATIPWPFRGFGTAWF